MVPMVVIEDFLGLQYLKDKPIIRIMSANNNITTFTIINNNNNNNILTNSKAN